MPLMLPEMFQLELVKIQNSSEKKVDFAEHDFVTFYDQYVQSELFPNL